MQRCIGEVGVFYPTEISSKGMIALFLLCRGKAMASGTEWRDDVDVDPNHAYDLLQNLKQMYKAVRI